MRVRSADQVPDLSADILFAIAAQAPRPDHGTADRQGEAPGWTWSRFGLLWVALVQLILAVPALFLGDDHGANLHVAHEIGSWDAALAVALLWVAIQPRRVAGLLPFAAALAAGLVVTALVDIVNGHTPALGEVTHLLTLVGVGLLWLLSRATPPSGRARLQLRSAR